MKVKGERRQTNPSFFMTSEDYRFLLLLDSETGWEKNGSLGH